MNTEKPQAWRWVKRGRSLLMIAESGVKGRRVTVAQLLPVVFVAAKIMSLPSNEGQTERNR